MSGSPISQPEVTLALANADLAIQNTEQRVLMVGQKTSAGSAADGVLVEQVGDDFESLFGPSSFLAGMVRAFRKVNPVVRLDVVPLDDAGGGTAREVEFTVTGTSTAAGTLTVVVASEKNHKFEVAIPSGTTATAAGALVTAAVNADTRVPFTCADAVGVVTLTADNAGAVLNDAGVEVVVDVAGLAVASVAETVAGATDPTLTSVLDVATLRYQGVVWPYSGNLTPLTDFLGPRFNPSNAVLDGVGFVGLVDSTSNLLSTLNGLNDQSLVAFVDEATSESLYVGPAQNEMPQVKASLFAGIRALRLTPDQPIGRFLTSSASLDQFGGPALASLPYFNTPFSDLPLIKAGRGFTALEIESLHDAGGAVIGDNTTKTSALAGEVVTTFKTDAAGNPDLTWKYLNYVDTGSGAREYFHNNLKARFSQTRLTEGSVTRGRDVANEAVVRAFLEKLYLDLAGPDFVLVQDGEAALKFFKENLSVTLDLSIGKVTVVMLVPIVTQLRTIVATMKIAFSTQS